VPAACQVVLEIFGLGAPACESDEHDALLEKLAHGVLVDAFAPALEDQDHGQVLLR